MRVAAYQMSVCGDAEANLGRIVEGIRSAAAEGAELIALPECALPGYPPLHYGPNRRVDAGEIARLSEQVLRAAREHGIAVVLGTIVEESGKLYNSALVISSIGELLGRYDKLHLMPDDKRFFAQGNGVPIFEVAGAAVGVLVCYDARFPEPFRYLREQGALLIVNISNACGGETWKRPVLEGTYRARASENSCFVVAVNSAGPLQMATSRIVGPLGLDLASAEPDREEMLFADIDFSETATGYFHDRRTDHFEVRASWTRSGPRRTSRRYPDRDR